MFHQPRFWGHIKLHCISAFMGVTQSLTTLFPEEIVWWMKIRFAISYFHVFWHFTQHGIKCIDTPWTSITGTPIVFHWQLQTLSLYQLFNNSSLILSIDIFPLIISPAFVCSWYFNFSQYLLSLNPYFNGVDFESPFFKL